MKILIIDDEESIRDSFKWHLESLGHDVMTFAAPLPCEPCIRQDNSYAFCHDVLIIDYDLPGMTGLEFIELMTHRNCKGVNAKKIIISARTDWIDARKARLLGCIIEEKPVDLNRISELIAV